LAIPHQRHNRGLGGLWLKVGEEVCHELHCHPQDNQVE
jgi:hypothetical protein